GKRGAHDSGVGRPPNLPTDLARLSSPTRRLHACAEEDISMAFLKQVTQRLALSGVLVGLVSGAPGAASAHQAKGTDVAKNHITTRGSGEVRARPDALPATVGVEIEAATLDKARREVNTKMGGILRSLRALGLSGMTLQTQAIQFSPLYEERGREREHPPKI